MTSFQKLLNSAIALIAAFVIILGEVEGVLRFAGKCPDLETVTNLDLRSLTGEWFDNRHYVPIFENANRCVKYQFTDPFGPYLKVEVAGKNSQNFQSISVPGTATHLGPKAILSMMFPSAYSTPLNYYVLGTDYVSYAVLWNCEDQVFGNTQNAIILTRSSNPSPYTVEAALRTIDANRLSRYMFVPIDQAFC